MEGHLISSVALSAILSSEKNNNGAEFTIKSHRTGKDFTYKIKRSKFNNVWYTHVCVEQDYLNFKRLGTYFNNEEVTIRHFGDYNDSIFRWEKEHKLSSYTKLLEKNIFQKIYERFYKQNKKQQNTERLYRNDIIRL